MFTTIINFVITVTLRLLLRFNPPPEPRVYKGEGSIKKLALHVADGELKSVFMVTSEGMIRRRKIEPIIEVFTEKGIRVEVFTDEPPNPPLDIVEKATALCLENDCGAVFAYGGGSVVVHSKQRRNWPRKKWFCIQAFLAAWRSTWWTKPTHLRWIV